ncbi:MAG TPA: hypothetical protein VME20_02705 [Acidimicrobiales bacterium]|nr:hypothetical protein [Acidimicrobiales bacterium]
MSPLSREAVAQTADWIASLQLPNGMVPWYRGGHADPWNHVEATMALAAAGRWPEVERAFAWLRTNQLADGSWCTFYLPDGVLDPRRDPNVCAYLATGAWWCHRLGADRAFLEEWWPMIERAISWCLRYQRLSGEIVWSVGPDGVPGIFALLAANSSLQRSLHCAYQVGSVLGRERPEWQKAAVRVAEAVAYRPAAFAPKERWAMDWYYPVLSGALSGEAARERLLARWGEFAETGLGVRCVSGNFWVTAAETAECAMAANRAGMREDAELLLAWAGHLRDPDDGSYWTGCAHPECVKFPGGQRSTYSAAAVLIADHVIWRPSAAAEVFSASGDELSRSGPGRPAEPVGQGR